MGLSWGLWGGLLLTFLLAFVGILASFLIGVLPALGRQSSLPVLKIFCTTFIEVVRGVPLITILFMFSLILPLFLPPGVRIVFFDDGQIVEQAPPSEFFANPREERTKLFLNQILTH
jgi:His/Glu/Gln/Arg/opine family amino acid ABC transporter permease subunit